MELRKYDADSDPMIQAWERRSDMIMIGGKCL